MQMFIERIISGFEISTDSWNYGLVLVFQLYISFHTWDGVRLLREQSRRSSFPDPSRPSPLSVQEDLKNLSMTINVCYFSVFSEENFYFILYIFAIV